jgi:serine O-acetyltransferase
MITELVGVSFIRSDQRDDLTAIIAALLRPGAKRRRCRASFNAPPTPGRTGGSHCAPGIIAAAIADLVAIRMRDPAAENYLSPFLYYKGFHALQWRRIGHWLWRDGRRELAHFLQSRVSEVFAVDIHPAVPIGSGVFIDHGTGLVVGETAVIGDDVSILHEVTLGGTGKERGDRHPKVRDGVLLCAGAKVLGNVEIGRDAKVGAGSVVLHNVPPRATVAGVPARIVGWSSGSVPALEMDQSLPDYEI